MITLQERVYGVALPPNWKLAKLHRVLRVRKGNKNVGMQEDNLLSLSYGRIVRKDIDSAEGLLPESFETYQIVDPGNIVMRLTDLQNDKRSLRQALVRERGIITSAYDALEVSKDHDPRFWAYALLALDLAKYYYSLGGGVRQSIKFADFPNDWILAPDGNTQASIADFLDYETTRVDRLIEKKQKLLELVREREEAAFLGAVTGKGCPGDKKPSGVEWIGAIPAHWSAPKFTHVARQETGHTPSRKEPDYWVPEECTIPWMSLSDIWQVRKGDQVYISETAEKISPIGMANSAARLLPPNTVMLSRTASVGFPAIAAVAMATTQDFACWICGKYIRPKYLYYVLRAMKPEFRRLMMGSTHQTIYMPDIRAFRTPLPPLAEQDEIVEKLDGSLGMFRMAAVAVEESVVRLREFRSSLITSAVTGQISLAAWDVRGQADRQLDDIQEAMRA